MSRIAIDPNVRVRGNLTYSGFEDVDGAMPSVGDMVDVVERESGLYGRGEVADLDDDARLVYLKIDWATLRLPEASNLDGLLFRDPRIDSVGGRG